MNDPLRIQLKEADHLLVFSESCPPFFFHFSKIKKNCNVLIRTRKEKKLVDIRDVLYISWKSLVNLVKGGYPFGFPNQYDTWRFGCPSIFTIDRSDIDFCLLKWPTSNPHPVWKISKFSKYHQISTSYAYWLVYDVYMHISLTIFTIGYP